MVGRSVSDDQLRKNAFKLSKVDADNQEKWMSTVMIVSEYKIAGKAAESWPRFKIFSLTDNSKLNTPMLRQHPRAWLRWRQASTEKCVILSLLWKTPGATDSEKKGHGSLSMHHKTRQKS